jgi:hypothetical protein
MISLDEMNTAADLPAALVGSWKADDDFRP